MLIQEKKDMRNIKIAAIYAVPAMYGDDLRVELDKATTQAERDAAWAAWSATTKRNQAANSESERGFRNGGYGY